MALLKLKIEIPYEIGPVDLEVQYGTDAAGAAEMDARTFQEDPGFVAEFLAEHAEQADVRVEVVIP